MTGEQRLMTGLVLTSGGARGAYQAGALSAIAEITQSKDSPFPIVSGISAGSINAVYLASHFDQFGEAMKKLSEIWSGLTLSKIFLTDSLTLTRTGVAWLSDLGLGGWFGTGHGRSLLVTEPLKNLLQEHLDFKKVSDHLKSGKLSGLAVTATNYYSGTSIVFYDGDSAISPWVRATRLAVRAEITLDHVLASSAIPVFFPAVMIKGSYYGDGCVRMSTPMSPAIHMGADRILAIGVRYERRMKSESDLHKLQRMHYPYLAEVAGVLLNAMFLDALDADIERMERINHTVSLLPQEKREHSVLREIPIMMLKPSRDLSHVVTEAMKDFAFPIRHLLKGLGVSEERGSDLMSYLAFDRAYTEKLAELGYHDAYDKKDELLRFLE